MATALPENPDPDRIRRQARDLARAVRAGDPGALSRIARHPVAVRPDGERFPLAAAQLVVAREYGFRSWPRLKRFLDTVRTYSWSARVTDAGDTPAEAFCRDACLTYTSDDGPERWARARRMLVAEPGLPGRDVWVAAACADVEAVARHLAADPGLARARGGGHGWSPLFHLVYSRLGPEPAPPARGTGRHDPVATARLLLGAGADPHEGYLWRGLPSPFTLLTGAFGAGEQGRAKQPPHPAAAELAQLVLAAGADANDAQTLYNRQFEPDDSHLVLLFAHGLGTGDGGVWARRLGEAADTPAAMLRHQLRWAIDHGMEARVRLLARHGTDLRSPFEDGRTPVQRALLAGHPHLADLLAGRGSPDPASRPGRTGGLGDGDVVPRLVAALLTGDRDAVAALDGAHAGALADLVRDRPGLVVWAAASGRRAAVELLLDLGFDVDARGRGDVPVEQPWQTALHEAAAADDVALIDLLLERGADPTVRDARFDATPLGWAEHLGQQAARRRLAEVTPP